MEELLPAGEMTQIKETDVPKQAFVVVIFVEARCELEDGSIVAEVAPDG